MAYRLVLLSTHCMVVALFVGCKRTEAPVAELERADSAVADTEPSTVFTPRLLSAHTGILDTLDMQATTLYTGATLGDVVAQLNDRELHEVPITIDSRSLAAKGFDLNQRFTGQFGGNSLRHGLARLLQECQLVLDYRFEQLVVTTAEDAEKWTDRTGIDILQLPAGTRWAEALNEETGVELLRVADWVRGFRERYGLDVQCASTVDDSEPGERIQVTMHEVRRPNRDRLRVLLGRGRLTATLEGNTMLIAPQHE